MKIKQHFNNNYNNDKKILYLKIYHSLEEKSRIRFKISVILIIKMIKSNYKMKMIMKKNVK